MWERRLAGKCGSYMLIKQCPAVSGSIGKDGISGVMGVKPGFLGNDQLYWNMIVSRGLAE